MPTVNITIPNGGITNPMIATAAGIEATKLEHQYSFGHYQTTGTAVVAAVQDFFIARSTGTIVQFEAAVTGAIATGGDRTVTCDLQKSTAAGAFATVLSSTIVLDNTSVLRTLEAGTISGTTFIDGDILRFVITVAGAAGNQAQGVIVTATIREDS